MQMKGLLKEYADTMGIQSGRIIVESAKAAGLSKDGFLLEEGDGKILIACRTNTGLTAALTELAENGTRNSGRAVNPRFSWRAHQRWLPFDMGQHAYGQQGYDYFDSRTDTWWFDRGFWKAYLFELAQGRYNAIHMWNVHPYPALIRFKKYPCAAYFSPERVEKNVEQFSWIVDAADALGIKIVLMQYNIHVSEGYAKKNGMPWVDNCGWGGKDTPEVRDYTRACLEELLELYPRLGGLMTAGELNKDAFDFYSQTISPVIKAAGAECNLHFRLWGQQDPEGIRQLVDLMQGQIQLWHKISHEQIWVPKTDSRIGKWRRLLGDVPINVSCGPGMASGLNYVEKVHFDPNFWEAQFDHLEQLGGTGFGYFSGADNHLYHAGEYEKQIKAQWARWYAGSASRKIVGRIGWGVTGNRNAKETYVRILAHELSVDEKAGREIFDAVTDVNAAFTQMSQYLGMYNSQDLGFASTLGLLSAGTEKENPGSFCFVACCAWPDDGFGGMDIPDVRQLAVDLRESHQADKFEEYIEQYRQMLTRIDILMSRYEIPENVIPLDEDDHYRPAAFLHHARQVGMAGLFKAAAVRAAILAYRAPFLDNTVESIEQAICQIDSVFEIMDEVGRQLKRGWSVQATIHRELSDFNIPGLYRRVLSEEKEKLSEILDALRSKRLDPAVYRAYGQSVYWYHEATRYLRMYGGYHNEPETLKKGQECIEKAESLVQGFEHETLRLWHNFLEGEIERLNPVRMDLRFDGGRAECSLAWEGAEFKGPMEYVGQMYQLVDNSGLKGLDRRIRNPKTVTIVSRPEGLKIFWPPMMQKDMNYRQVDESLAPHEKISPYIFRENDHYQFSISKPQDNGVYNVKIVPGEKRYECRYGRLNPPHGLKQKDLDCQGVKVLFGDESTELTVDWSWIGEKPHPGQIWRMNFVQTRDFWEFVVSSWSFVCMCDTFLDKSQSGEIRWL